MSVSKNQLPPVSGASASDGRVTTLISCAGVRPMQQTALSASIQGGANENHWFDAAGWRRRVYANLAAVGVAGMMLYGGLWIVTEFVRLQKLEACFEAGRRDCVPLDMNRRSKSAGL